MILYGATLRSVTISNPGMGTNRIIYVVSSAAAEDRQTLQIAVAGVSASKLREPRSSLSYLWLRDGLGTGTANSDYKIAMELTGGDQRPIDRAERETRKSLKEHWSLVEAIHDCIAARINPEVEVIEINGEWIIEAVREHLPREAA